MRALVCQGGELEVTDVPDPVPGKGQVLLSVLACGICGSDLHARRHCDELADDAAAAGYDAFMRSDQAVVMGHEFCGEVVDASSHHRAGTRVVAMPLLRARSGPVGPAGAKTRPVHLTGLTTEAPGGYAEQVVVQDSLAFAVPNGLASTTAALTEPMAVALHAVRRGQVSKGQVALVIGCGPIGLGVIAMLKAAGVKQVVASDFSPGRRALATAMGADLVVDPAVDSPFDHAGRVLTTPQLLDLAVGTMDKLRAVPFLPWQRVFRAAELAGATPKGPVVFECVGVPGMLEQVIRSAPLYARVVVVGVCMGDDRIRPSVAINKEVDLRFVLGYTPAEFAEALRLVADGKVDPTPLLTGSVGLDGIAGAFDALGDPETHAKIVVEPQTTGAAISPVV